MTEVLLLAAPGLAAVPVMAVLGLFAFQCAWYSLVPRRWRIAYRQEHGREGARSAYIPDRLRRRVYFADRHRCAYCRGRSGLQVDHVIPWSAGGVTALFNLMTLCGTHNRVKLNYSRDRDGYEHYSCEHGDRAGLPEARRILAAERRHRLNPFRMLRIAWALVLL